jgi:hypothetical protein
MPNMYSDHQNRYKSTELRLSFNVIGMTEEEAVNKINEKYCIPFVSKRDKMYFTPENPTGHSYRINLEVVKGKVVRTSIG